MLPDSAAVATECHAVTERDFRLLAEKAIDLTTEGLLIRSEQPVQLGERVFVAFRLPPRGSWIDAEAEVAGIVEDEGGQVRVELRFQRMERMWQAVLREALAPRELDATAA